MALTTAEPERQRQTRYEGDSTRDLHPLPGCWRFVRVASIVFRRSGAATTAAEHESQHGQRAQGCAAVTTGGRTEGALGRDLVAGFVVGPRHDRVCGDVDTEGELARELIRAGLQIAGCDVLSIAEQRAALVFAGRVASLDRVGLTALVVVGLAAQHAISIHFFSTLVFHDTQTLGLTVRTLIAAATAFALGIAVVSTVLLTLAVIAIEATVGNGTGRAATGALADTHLVGAFAADGFALFGTGVGACFLTASDVRRGATLAAHAVGFLGANLLHRGCRAGRLAFLDRFEFALGINAQEHAAAFIERLCVRGLGREHDSRQ